VDDDNSYWPTATAASLLQIITACDPESALPVLITGIQFAVPRNFKQKRNFFTFSKGHFQAHPWFDVIQLDIIRSEIVK